MDKASLVNPDIAAGNHLLSALERAGLAISIAAWLKLRDTGEWNLFIASPDVQTHGPTTVNKFIDRVRTAIESELSMDEITAVNTTNHFVNGVSPLSFASSIHSKGGVHRLGSRPLGEADIEDGFVYKVERNVKASREAPRANAEALKKAKLAA